MAKKQSITRQIMNDVRIILSKYKHDPTRNQYIRDSKRFVKYCRTHYDCRCLDECKEHIQDYVDFQMETGKTASTVHTYIMPACIICNVKIADYIKPIRHTADYIKSRCTTDNTLLCTNHDRSSNKWERSTSFNDRVGIRRAEIEDLCGRNLKLDESGYWCVEVEHGKNGKYQLQRLFAENVDFVMSYFEGKAPDEPIFSFIELNNKVNYQESRIRASKNAYIKYYIRILKDPSYAAQLEQEIRARWALYNIDKKKHRPRPFKESEITGIYRVKQKNYQHALENGLPTEYNKLALMATSIFKVTSNNYL